MIDAKTTASRSINSLTTEQLNRSIELLDHVEALQVQISRQARSWPDIVFALLNGHQLSPLEGSDTREALSRALLPEGRVLKQVEELVQELRHQRAVLLAVERLIALNCCDDEGADNA
ncbi:hypothetical protein [uncultured Mailhella sp.]|uniref:hypothetical protein n=1 Tax=uncultured Mailhella sp. TaxID=1981031 RepID=UPI003208B80E